jgi:dihydroxyacetone kinase-like protein
MAIDTAALRTTITAILAKLQTEHEGLTELDGKIGDGDLGVTLLKAFRQLNDIQDTLPADLGQALLTSASNVAKVSSSSFGTLMATALIAVSKTTKGTESLPWSQISPLVATAWQAMAIRGKANLGDKTVLDALDAIANATAGLDDPKQILAAAQQAVDTVLDDFRQKPNKIGRARIFAERSIGLDDPGMVAVKVMLAGLAEA